VSRQLLSTGSLDSVLEVLSMKILKIDVCFLYLKVVALVVDFQMF
jgi:hypothetical protein